MQVKDKLFSINFLLAIILFVSLIFRLVLAINMPFYDPPDEIRRMHILESIYYDNHVPVFGEETNHFTVIQPLLGYRLNAYIAKIIPVEIPLYVKFRLGSIIWGLVAIIVSYFIAKRIFKKSKFLQVGTVLALAFWPQFIYVSSYINIDSFSVMTSSMAILFLVKAYQAENMTYKLALGLGVTLGLVFLSKENAYSIFILAVLILLPLLLRKFFYYLKFFSLSFLSFIVFPALFYLRNFLIYGKLYIFGHGAIADNVSFQEAIYNLDGRDYPVITITLKEIFTDSWFMEKFYKSIFATFGHMTLYLNDNFYYIFLLFVFLSSFGMLVYYVDNLRKKNKENYYLFLSFSITIVAMVFIIILHNIRTVLQPQGRYMLPLLVPMVVLMQWGLFKIVKNKELAFSLVSLLILFIMLSGIYSFIILL